MDDPTGWSLTESDPQVFTQLLRDLGVKGLQVVNHLLSRNESMIPALMSRMIYIPWMHLCWIR
jgi:hypothetical protein